MYECLQNVTKLLYRPSHFPRIVLRVWRIVLSLRNNYESVDISVDERGTHVAAYLNPHGESLVLFSQFAVASDQFVDSHLHFADV